MFFSQDGATANEAAYKLARRHGWELNPDGSRLEIVAAEGSFHGRTMGALPLPAVPPSVFHLNRCRGRCHSFLMETWTRLFGRHPVNGGAVPGAGPR